MDEKIKAFSLNEADDHVTISSKWSSTAATFRHAVKTFDEGIVGIRLLLKVSKHNIPPPLSREVDDYFEKYQGVCDQLEITQLEENTPNEVVNEEVSCCLSMSSNSCS